jgi:lipopolysaccharide heptosyltransferase I
LSATRRTIRPPACSRGCATTAPAAARKDKTARALSRLLVVRLGSLGDLVHTLPAVSAIRRAHPDVEIDWLVDAAHREFLELVPILSSVVVLKRPTPGGWWDARRMLRARQYAAALDFQGLIKSGAIAWLSGARRTIGFDKRSLREPLAAAFYSEVVPVGDAAHVIEKNLHLAARVGADASRLEFPLAPVQSAALEAIRQQGILSFALLNGGAAWPNKRWPAERFGRLAAWLGERHGLRSVVLWGPGEAELAATIVRISGGAAVAAPETRLPDLVALARDARLIVSGDTGPTHIAGAVGTPVVALFGPTDPARNGPWGPGDREISRYDRCDCHYERRCRRDAEAWCLASITEDEVRRAIDARLGAG